MTGASVLDVHDLSVELELKGTRREVVRGAEFSVGEGEILGIVGQTGSGKSVTLRAIMGLLPARGRVTSGSITLQGRDLLSCGKEEYRRLRGQQLSLIPQQPLGALNPVWSVGAHFEAVIKAHRSVSKNEIRELSSHALSRLGLTDPQRVLASYAHELSGGIAQRVVLALALILSPRLLLADEPTTALDVTVQREILDLIRRLCREDGLGVVLVTHDLGIVANYCDHMVIMNRGAIVESGRPSEVLSNPAAEYSRQLVAATGRNS